MRQLTKWNRVAVGGTLIAIMLSGCKSFQENVTDSKLMFWKKKEITDGSNAQKMVAIWSESMTYGGGKTPMRGVGGRLYFYDQQRMPTKIEGDLIVYIYDDEKNATQPDRKVVVPADEFNSKYSETDFGPSYSVWIPWDKVGNPQQSISLVPVFKSTSGQLVVGDHSRTILPGKSQTLREKTTTFELNAKKTQKQQNGVQPVSFDEQKLDSTDELATTKKSRRHTIRLSPSMKHRMIHSAKEQHQRLRLRQQYGHPTTTIYGELPQSNVQVNENENPIRNLISP